MLIVFVSIIVLGLSIFIVQWIKQINTNEISSRCLYNAYAGVNYSLYQCRNSASLTNGTININPNNNFTLSTVGSGTRTLDEVRINNSNVWTNNTLIGICPVTLNMTDVTIPANTTRTVNRIRWTSSMSGQTVYWGFIMGDSTTTSICTVYPQQGSSCPSSGGGQASSLVINATASSLSANRLDIQGITLRNTSTSSSITLTRMIIYIGGSLTIKSMGKTTGSNIYRSVQAVYNNAPPAKITDYDEIAQTVP